MDAITYFLTALTLHNIVLVLLAFLFGLIFGKIVFGHYREKFQRCNAKLIDCQAALIRAEGKPPEKEPSTSKKQKIKSNSDTSS